MATAARPLAAGEEENASVVKVVRGGEGNALYFSRSLIPYPRSESALQPLAHLGLYGFSARFLQEFARLPETDLERAEGLEQLRALYYGHAIAVVVGPWSSVAVDTREDLERVRHIYQSAPVRSEQRRHA
jgi:3-deoxy-manno-octulosonate cytidylyltransferase (CMP-KDO synthetase)